MALFEKAILTNIGILQEPGHSSPWVMAREGTPSRTKVWDYSARWGIEPEFSDFNSRGLGLQETQLQNSNRLDSLLLIMSLARYWGVLVGRNEAQNNPNYTEKKSRNTH